METFFPRIAIIIVAATLALMFKFGVFDKTDDSLGHFAEYQNLQHEGMFSPKYSDNAVFKQP